MSTAEAAKAPGREGKVEQEERKSMGVSLGLLSEAIGLVLVVIGTLIWWQIRGRISVAPDQSAFVDGRRFVGLTVTVFICAQIALLPIIFMIKFSHRGHWVKPYIFWTVVTVGAGTALWKTEVLLDAVDFIKEEVLGPSWVRYLESQEPLFRSELFYIGRLIALLLVWQAILGLFIYWPLRLVKAIVSYALQSVDKIFRSQDPDAAKHQGLEDSSE